METFISFAFCKQDVAPANSAPPAMPPPPLPQIYVQETPVPPAVQQQQSQQVFCQIFDLTISISHHSIL